MALCCGILQQLNALTKNKTKHKQRPRYFLPQTLHESHVDHRKRPSCMSQLFVLALTSTLLLYKPYFLASPYTNVTVQIAIVFECICWPLAYFPVG